MSGMESMGDILRKDLQVRMSYCHCRDEKKVQ